MESIYNWVKTVPPPPARPEMYHSTHLPLTNSTLREATRAKAGGVMGRDLRGTVHPDRFLRAHELTSSAVDPEAVRELRQ